MKILIRATNWVGDAIMALPALRAVRTKFPDAHIAIVARPYVADIYRDQSICDELIPYDPKGPHRGWKGRETLAKDLRAKRFDIALLLQNAFDAAWLVVARAYPATNRLRPRRTKLPVDQSDSPSQSPAKFPRTKNSTISNCSVASDGSDALHDDAHIKLHVGDPERQQAASTLREAGVRPNALRIAVGAGASYGSAKCWPPDRFAQTP